MNWTVFLTVSGLCWCIVSAYYSTTRTGYILNTAVAMVLLVLLVRPAPAYDCPATPPPAKEINI